MNEKRFTFSYKGIHDELTNTSYGFRENDVGVGKLCDLLNELSENLTGCNKTANNAIDTIKALDEDNKQLRILVESLKMENKKLKGRLTDLGVEYY